MPATELAGMIALPFESPLSFSRETAGASGSTTGGPARVFRATLTISNSSSGTPISNSSRGTDISDCVPAARTFPTPSVPAGGRELPRLRQREHGEVVLRISRVVAAVAGVGVARGGRYSSRFGGRTSWARIAANIFGVGLYQDVTRLSMPRGRRRLTEHAVPDRGCRLGRRASCPIFQKTPGEIVVLLYLTVVVILALGGLLLHRQEAIGSSSPSRSQHVGALVVPPPNCLQQSPGFPTPPAGAS
mmetsp:Transcript_27108/g.57577  ORF Transcript_27108/g.57577 Transcript_27108/m.57577 type:complete len:246 (-) Transcript_27108:83-820(-)